MFSRLRVSTPSTQILINQSSPLNQRLITDGEISGSGTSSSYDSVTASTTLTVSTSVGLRRLKSRVCGIYQAGKSLLYFFTFNLNAASAGVVKRVGYFDNKDGIFLEQQPDGTLSWVIRSSSSGSVVETERVTQSNWNKDKFDGTSAGYNFDQSQCHIAFIALEWLGVGDVAVGFVYNGVPTIANYFSHPNQRDAVYIRTANLFPSYEIERTIAGSVSASLDTICAVLLTEGSQDYIGQTFSVARPLISGIVTAKTAGNYYPLLLFRLNPNKINSRVRIIDLEVIVSTNCIYYLYLVKEPTFNTAYTPTWVDKANSSVQYDNAIPDTVTVTNALSNETWTTAAARTNVGTSGGSSADNLDYMGTDYNYNPETWALVIQCDSGNVNVSAAIVKLWEQI
jgi:hypothetical protein